MKPFVLQLLGTLVLFVAVVWTGHERRRRLHLALVFLALASLAATIYFAERLGREYDLQAAGWITPVHLALAKVTTLAMLGPLVTGVMTWRDVRHLAKHRACVVVAFGLVFLALVTGTWMILAAEAL